MVCHQIDEKHLIPFPFALDFPHVVVNAERRDELPGSQLEAITTDVFEPGTLDSDFPFALFGIVLQHGPVFPFDFCENTILIE